MPRTRGSFGERRLQLVADVLSRAATQTPSGRVIGAARSRETLGEWGGTACAAVATGSTAAPTRNPRCPLRASPLQVLRAPSAEGDELPQEEVRPLERAAHQEEDQCVEAAARCAAHARRPSSRLTPDPRPPAPPPRRVNSGRSAFGDARGSPHARPDVSFVCQRGGRARAREGGLANTLHRETDVP